jgi:predicted enzyme related to lactoylglutathione lyase
MQYLMFQEDGWGGAVFPSDEPGSGPTVYFGSDDIDADIGRVRDLGGTAEKGAPIPQVGWFAVCADTEGNAFSLFQSDESAAID